MNPIVKTLLLISSLVMIGSPFITKMTNYNNDNYSLEILYNDTTKENETSSFDYEIKSIIKEKNKKRAKRSKKGKGKKSTKNV